MLGRLTLTAAVAATALTLLSAAPALTQEATFAPAKLILPGEDGEEFEYTLGDASFYVSSNPGYDDVEPTIDFSLSLSAISPIDANLLEWSAQSPGKSKNDTRDIIVIGTDGAEGEVRYEVTDAKVTSVSLSQSTYSAPGVSLSLMAGNLTINGIAMN